MCENQLSSDMLFGNIDVIDMLVVCLQLAVLPPRGKKKKKTMNAGLIEME